MICYRYICTTLNATVLIIAIPDVYIIIIGTDMKTAATFLPFWSSLTYEESHAGHHGSVTWPQ